MRFNFNRLTLYPWGGVVFLLSLFLLPSVQASGQFKDKFLTHYEKSGFNKTPRYDETVEYSKMLAQSSRLVTYKSMGISPQGREIPLLILDKD